MDATRDLLATKHAMSERTGQFEAIAVLQLCHGNFAPGCLFAEDGSCRLVLPVERLGQTLSERGLARQLIAACERTRRSKSQRHTRARLHVLMEARVPSVITRLSGRILVLKSWTAFCPAKQRNSCGSCQRPRYEPIADANFCSSIPKAFLGTRVELAAGLNEIENARRAPRSRNGRAALILACLM